MCFAKFGFASNNASILEGITDKTSENTLATAKDYIKALQKTGCPIDKTKDWTAVTDPNKLLGTEHQYTSKSDFADTTCEQAGSYLVGGTVEVFADKSDCESRYKYLKKMPVFLLSDRIYKADTVILRIASAVSSADAEAYKTAFAKIAQEGVSVNPLLDCEIQTADVMNGSKTEVLGQRAYIEIEKDTLKSVTEKQFKEFADTVVDGSGYNWFSIICPDKTGLIFTGSNIAMATYGDLNDEGAVANLIGYAILSQDNTYKYELKS